MIVDFIYDLMGSWNPFWQSFSLFLFELVELLFGYDKAERWFT